jgi:hypothetical protein
MHPRAIGHEDLSKHLVLSPAACWDVPSERQISANVGGEEGQMSKGLGRQIGTSSSQISPALQCDKILTG